MDTTTYGLNPESNCSVSSTRVPVYMYPKNPPMNFDWGELTEDHRRSLGAMGLPVNTFLFYRDLFIGNAFDFCTLGLKGFRENGRRQHLTHDHLLNHLAGTRTYSTRCRRSSETTTYQTAWFNLDLDFVEGEDLRVRYDLVCEAVGTTPIVFESSQSKGLHCYWFFEKPVDLFSILNPFTHGGAVPRALHRLGLSLAPKFIECYPQARGRNFCGNAIRAAFGPASWLLCPDELVPTHATNISALRAVHQRFLDGKIEFVDVSALGRGKSSVRSKRSIKRSNPDGRLTEIVARLDLHGLEKGRNRDETMPSFNRAIFLKSVDFAVRGVEQPLAQRLLIGWLDAKHNGNSATYNHSRERACSEAVEVLTRVYSRWKHRQWWVRRPGLTEGEFALIEAVTPTPVVVDDEGGEHAPFKFAAFLFHIVNGMKQWVLSRAIRDAEYVLADNPNLQLGSPEFDAAFTRRAKTWWPFPPAPVFHVDCPYRYRLMVDGISERTTNLFWSLALQCGLFRKVRNHDTYRNRSEVFAVTLDFAAPSHSAGFTFTSIAEAIRTMTDRSVILQSASKHYRLRIEDEGTEAMTSRLEEVRPETVRAYVEDRLRARCVRCFGGESDAA